MTKMNMIIENKGWVIMLKEPLLFYKNNDGIKFYLVNCGAGLTHLIIFPNNIVMLFDCNLIQDEEHPNRNKDYILNFFKNVIPNPDKPEPKFCQNAQDFVVKCLKNRTDMEIYSSPLIFLLILIGTLIT